MKAKTPRKPSASAKELRRFWLTIPSKIVQRPVIWEIGHRFKLVTNIGQASVTTELGIISLSIEGQRSEIKRAISWMEKLGVKVEPVEMNTIE